MTPLLKFLRHLFTTTTKGNDKKAIAPITAMVMMIMMKTMIMAMVIC